MNGSWLQALLNLTAVFAGTFSLLELTRANQKILPGVIDGLGYLLDETPDAFRQIQHDVLAEAAALLPGV